MRLFLFRKFNFIKDSSTIYFASSMDNGFNPENKKDKNDLGSLKEKTKRIDKKVEDFLEGFKESNDGNLEKTEQLKIKLKEVEEKIEGYKDRGYNLDEEQDELENLRNSTEELISSCKELFKEAKSSVPLFGIEFKNIQKKKINGVIYNHYFKNKTRLEQISAIKIKTIDVLGDEASEKIEDSKIKEYLESKNIACKDNNESSENKPEEKTENKPEETVTIDTPESKVTEVSNDEKQEKIRTKIREGFYSEILLGSGELQNELYQSEKKLKTLNDGFLVKMGKGMVGSKLLRKGVVDNVANAIDVKNSEDVSEQKFEEDTYNIEKELFSILHYSDSQIDNFLESTKNYKDRIVEFENIKNKLLDTKKFDKVLSRYNNLINEHEKVLDLRKKIKELKDKQEEFKKLKEDNPDLVKEEELSIKNIKKFSKRYEHENSATSEDVDKYLEKILEEKALMMIGGDVDIEGLRKKDDKTEEEKKLLERFDNTNQYLQNKKEELKSIFSEQVKSDKFKSRGESIKRVWKNEAFVKSLALMVIPMASGALVGTSMIGSGWSALAVGAKTATGQAAKFGITTVLTGVSTLVGGYVTGSGIKGSVDQRRESEESGNTVKQKGLLATISRTSEKALGLLAKKGETLYDKKIKADNFNETLSEELNNSKTDDDKVSIISKYLGSIEFLIKDGKIKEDNRKIIENNRLLLLESKNSFNEDIKSKIKANTILEISKIKTLDRRDTIKATTIGVGIGVATSLIFAVGFKAFRNFKNEQKIEKPSEIDNIRGVGQNKQAEAYIAREKAEISNNAETVRFQKIKIQTAKTATIIETPTETQTTQIETPVASAPKPSGKFNTNLKENTLSDEFGLNKPKVSVSETSPSTPTEQVVSTPESFDSAHPEIKDIKVGTTTVSEAVTSTPKAPVHNIKGDFDDNALKGFATKPKVSVSETPPSTPTEQVVSTPESFDSAHPEIKDIKVGTTTVSEAVTSTPKAPVHNIKGDFDDNALKGFATKPKTNIQESITPIETPIETQTTQIETPVASAPKPSGKFNTNLKENTLSDEFGLNKPKVSVSETPTTVSEAVTSTPKASPVFNTDINRKGVLGKLDTPASTPKSKVNISDMVRGNKKATIETSQSTPTEQVVSTPESFDSAHPEIKDIKVGTTAASEAIPYTPILSDEEIALGLKPIAGPFSGYYKNLSSGRLLEDGTSEIYFKGKYIGDLRLNGRETISYLSSISNKLDSFTSNKEAIEFMKNMPTTNGKGFDLGKLSIKLNDGTKDIEIGLTGEDNDLSFSMEKGNLIIKSGGDSIVVNKDGVILKQIGVLDSNGPAIIQESMSGPKVEQVVPKIEPPILSDEEIALGLKPIAGPFSGYYKNLSSGRLLEDGTSEIYFKGKYIGDLRLNGRETISYLSSISNKLDSFTSNKEAIEFMKNMPTTNGKGFDLGKLSIKLNDGTKDIEIGLTGEDNDLSFSMEKGNLIIKSGGDSIVVNKDGVILKQIGVLDSNGPAIIQESISAVTPTEQVASTPEVKESFIVGKKGVLREEYTEGIGKIDTEARVLSDEKISSGIITETTRTGGINNLAEDAKNDSNSIREDINSKIEDIRSYDRSANNFGKLKSEVARELKIKEYLLRNKETERIIFEAAAKKGKTSFDEETANLLVKSLSHTPEESAEIVKIINDTSGTYNILSKDFFEIMVGMPKGNIDQINPLSAVEDILKDIKLDIGSITRDALGKLHLEFTYKTGGIFGLFKNTTLGSIQIPDDTSTFNKDQIVGLIKTVIKK